MPAASELVALGLGSIVAPAGHGEAEIIGKIAAEPRTKTAARGAAAAMPHAANDHALPYPSPSRMRSR